MRKGEYYFGMGNEAIVEGAIAAGARFYAGYPITPSSEIAEVASVRLPQVDGIYIQMEDEDGSVPAIIGASAAGMKALTASSGPGISNMQENIGAAMALEVPCVIIDIQRGGPSTGRATKPSQGDVMQARWGRHGDYDMVVYSPSTVQECYDLIIRCFNISERYRCPVIFLGDEVVAHLRESYFRWQPEPDEIVFRRQPTGSQEDYAAYDFEPWEDEVAPLAPLGTPGFATHMTCIHHSKKGLNIVQGQEPPAVRTDKLVRHFTNKIQKNKHDIWLTKRYFMDDAEYAVVTYGCSLRPSLAAVKAARAKGVKVGIAQMLSIWPFNDELITELLGSMKAVIVPEMNLGMMRDEMRKYNSFGTPLIGVNRVDAEIITPEEVLAAIEEVAK